MGQNQKKGPDGTKNNLNDDFCDQRMDMTDSDSIILRIKLQYLGHH
jgi:hypothetical protein